MGLKIINDNWHQYYQSCGLTLVEKEKRRDEVLHCEHKFVLLKRGGWTGGFHSSDYEYQPNLVECVHCGLTNKFVKMEEINNNIYGEKKYSFENELFLECFAGSYGYKGRFNENDIRLISSVSIDSCHIRTLYKLAKRIYPEGLDKDLFDIMLVLDGLETEEEKIGLECIRGEEALLDRYKNKCLGDVLVKKLKRK